MKSPEYLQGFCDALVYASDIFESHTNAFLKAGLLRNKDVKLVVNILDAMIRRREVIADVGSRGVNLFVSKKRTASLKEK